MPSQMSSKVKATAQEELDRVAGLTKDAAKSQAYIYPFKGVLYFLSHRTLWKPLMSKLAPLMSVGLGVTTAMFLFTYLPQAALLAIFEGPVAAVSTILLVLSESSTIVNVLSRGFLVEDVLVDTFDGTLISKNQTTLVESGRSVKAGRDPINRLGKMIKKPFAKYTPSAIIRYFIYWSLNLIPVFGTVLFIILQGKRAGPNAHSRYFQLKGMSATQKEAWIEQRNAAYTSFGVAATLLEMVPVVGILFAFTNQVGAALWAADLETMGTTSPRLREEARKAR